MCVEGRYVPSFPATLRSEIRNVDAFDSGFFSLSLEQVWNSESLSMILEGISRPKKTEGYQ
jgi:hypothetical protein